MAPMIITPSSQRSTSTLLLLLTSPKPLFRSTTSRPDNVILHSKPPSSTSHRTLRSRRRVAIGLPNRSSELWTVSAAAEDALPAESALESARAQHAAPSTSNDVSSTIISVLLFFALIGLAILTIGVIYLGVTDFLHKREREKFEKEEPAEKKKRGKKGKAKAKAGPRGFGQKVDVDECDDGDD